MTGRLWRVLGVAAGIACLLWAQGPATAARSTPGFSLTVSPTRMVIPAGTVSTTQKFLVSNRGKAPYQVTVDKADFTASESGALNFLARAPYAAANWVHVTPTRFRMEAGTTKNVTFRISLPDRAEPGDHQFALIFKVPAGRNSANIRINRGIAAPVFIAVPGSADNMAQVTDLRAPGFALHGPVPITAAIHDSGTIHRDFRGPRRLFAAVGGATVRFPDFTVLRGSTREVSARWNPPLMCVCHATVSVPRASGVPSAATVRIIVFPLHLVPVVLGALVALLLLRWFIRRRFRAKVLAAASALHDGEIEDGRDV